MTQPRNDNLAESSANARRCLIVGEVAMAHDGSLGLAHAYIDAIARAGGDAVKFQTHIAAAESTGAEPWRVNFSYQDQRRIDYWKRTEFTEPQWRGLKEHADSRGLLFLSSPFSIEAAEMLSGLGMKVWKVASGEVSNFALLSRILELGGDVVLSSGMSSLAELDAAVALVKAKGTPLTVAQCTSMYPCPPQHVGVNMIEVFRDRYQCAVGLSDHSGTIFPGLIAASHGAEFLEVHVTMSREMFGPDVPVSLTMPDFKQLVEGVRFVEKMTANPVQKDDMARNMQPLRDLFTKSVVARCDIPAGTVLRAEHLALKKPGTGIPASQLQALLGRVTRQPLATDQLLQLQDLQ
jgi:N-acetylneuraminate synthase